MDEKQFIDRVLAAERKLYGMAYLLLSSEQDREDAVQEAILRAWRGKDRLRDQQYFETWLTRILINECRRLRSARRVPEGEMPDPYASWDSPEPDLHRSMAALPEKLRLPVILKYVQGYTVREIASILRLPQGTAASRLRRALTALKKDLEVDEHDKTSL